MTSKVDPLLRRAESAGLMARELRARGANIEVVAWWRHQSARATLTAFDQLGIIVPDDWWPPAQCGFVWNFR